MSRAVKGEGRFRVQISFFALNVCSNPFLFFPRTRLAMLHGAMCCQGKALAKKAQGDFELKKSKLFHALEAQYSRNKAMEMIRSVAQSQEFHISLKARNIHIASLIEE